MVTDFLAALFGNPWVTFFGTVGVMAVLAVTESVLKARGRGVYVSAFAIVGIVALTVTVFLGAMTKQQGWINSALWAGLVLCVLGLLGRYVLWNGEATAPPTSQMKHSVDAPAKRPDTPVTQGVVRPVHTVTAHDKPLSSAALKDFQENFLARIPRFGNFANDFYNNFSVELNGTIGLAPRNWRRLRDTPPYAEALERYRSNYLDAEWDVDTSIEGARIPPLVIFALGLVVDQYGEFTVVDRAPEFTEMWFNMNAYLERVYRQGYSLSHLADYKDELRLLEALVAANQWATRENRSVDVSNTAVAQIRLRLSGQAAR